MKHKDPISLSIVAQGAIIIALAVIIGAFGAHSLKSHLTEYQLSIFETGNRYHFYHGFGVLILAGLSDLISVTQLKRVTTLLIIGTILFSGSLYLLATREFLSIDHWKFLGPLTPIGGLFFIFGWVYLAWATINIRKNNLQP